MKYEIDPMITLDEKQKFFAFLAAAFGAFVVIGWLAPGAFKILALSFGLAYLLDPVADWLEGKKVPRTWAVLGIILLVVGLLSLVLALVIPYLIDQAAQFIREAPQLAEQALARVAQWHLFPEEMTRSVPDLLREIKRQFLEGGLGTLRPLVGGLLDATSGVMGVLLAMVNVIIVPIFLFFFLRDFDRIRGEFYRFVPDHLEGRARDFFGMVDGVLSGFIRGQIIVALFLAVLYSLGLGLSGIRFGILIGTVAGILFIVPYVGTVTGILASAVVLIVDFSGWGQVAAVAATFGIAQAIEGYVLTPRIVGNRVGLNQLETLLAIMVGGEMGGFAGLLIAIPAAGIIKKTIHFLRQEAAPPAGERDERLYMAELEGEEEENSESGV